MKYAELIKKVMAEGVDKLSEDEKAQLAAYQDVDVEKLANDRAAKARREETDKATKLAEEKQALQEQLTALQEQADKAQGKEKTDLEKLQAKVEKLTNDLKVVNESWLKAQADNKALVRKQKIDKVFAPLKFVEGVDPEDAKALLERRLADLKDEDLDDEELVNERVEKFKVANKALIFVPGASGSGYGENGEGKGGEQGARKGKVTKIDGQKLLDDALGGSLEDAQKAVDEANEASRQGAAVV